MTDREIIIQALRCLGGETVMCNGCAYLDLRFRKCQVQCAKDALALINRQQAELENANFTIEQLTKGNLQLQAEIERLTINMNAFGLGMKREKGKADIIRAEAIKEVAKDIHEEICKALDNNYKVRNQRIERHLTDELSETCDVFVQYVEGNIDALRGIDGFVCDYVKEMVGEDK